MKPSVVSTCFAVLIVLLAKADNSLARTFGNDVNQFTIDFLVIDHPDNPADTNGSLAHVGSVDYVYGIAKYEVSRQMVNKANELGGLEITLDTMSVVVGGPRPDMPATGVSWNEAARFVNWLNISKGFQPAYKFALQPRAEGYSASSNILLWQSGDPGYNPANPFRNSLAQYFLPSVNEWHKAAYYDSNANAGAGGYWSYPTGSDTAPIAISDGTAAGTAVYRQPIIQGPADIHDAGGLSPYGVMGMGGNAWEWNETASSLSNDDGSSFRILRGGVWSSTFDFNLAASFRSGADPLVVGNGVGFRVASASTPDLNEDGTVDAADAAVMFQNWGNSGLGDLTIDGIVDAADAGILFANWTGDSHAVPEPSTLLLTLLICIRSTIGTWYQRQSDAIGYDATADQC